MSIPTPNLSHLTKNDFLHVYEPSEDSFLMMDSLEDEIEWICSNRDIIYVCEVGSGSGCISAFLISLLKTNLNNSFLHIATDINFKACLATQKTIASNCNKSLNCNDTSEILCTSFTSGIRMKFDLIIFNPPYVPTSNAICTQNRTCLDAAWDGKDERGRKVIDDFLAQLNVSKNGHFA